MTKPEAVPAQSERERIADILRGYGVPWTDEMMDELVPDRLTTPEPQKEAPNFTPVATLRAIAAANWRHWDDGMNTPENAIMWAQSIARHALSLLPVAPPPAPEGKMDAECAEKRCPNCGDPEGHDLGHYCPAPVVASRLPPIKHDAMCANPHDCYCPRVAEGDEFPGTEEDAADMLAAAMEGIAEGESEPHNYVETLLADYLKSPEFAAQFKRIATPEEGKLCDWEIAHLPSGLGLRVGETPVDTAIRVMSEYLATPKEGGTDV